ncbi:signal peptidase I [Nostocoides sp. F2B08]|uniref:signal peptidase I n=1 Tax=Nostocoides sp. F2B08 TaxID=2653936 RepID=UPI001263497F|nr:signal peptidase I [Tetrasphaera sp. F2B08]KAB7741892.1 signal peptidase I [Tetrasphaera sp. F2B08]
MPAPDVPTRPSTRDGRTRTRAAVTGAVVGGLLLLAAVEPLEVVSDSMDPTLNPGDHVVVEKLSVRWRTPEVGDLVVFRVPQGRELVVKRVVALGGQTVGLEDAVLVVDGKARHEPQVDLTRIDSTYFGPVTVPPGAVFVLGDNRAESIDSRTYGAIPYGELIGTVLLTF